jgi:hypothetical protein
MKWRFEVGTLLVDAGKVCIVVAHLPTGCETFEGYAKINWRDNYELLYPNRTTYVIGATALHRLVDQGQINLLSGADNT